ncbi:hypothetical protein HELRODRAFT_167771 [Helobdella robusta]|uniref:Uncharacterized protein n=1 Tax=Helobdella robusta TaxID=6412 RepID=T1EZS5_HELRO|nr:hypothetical protein HELRODRAFT_167771 [Helobdella robusta]ESO09944.1 hypothetical protein HELRODRAFT_167771 [Helobdella robusta]
MDDLEAEIQIGNKITSNGSMEGSFQMHRSAGLIFSQKDGMSRIRSIPSSPSTPPPSPSSPPPSPSSRHLSSLKKNNLMIQHSTVLVHVLKAEARRVINDSVPSLVQNFECDRERSMTPGKLSELTPKVNVQQIFPESYLAVKTFHKRKCDFSSVLNNNEIVYVLVFSDQL